MAADYNLAFHFIAAELKNVSDDVSVTLFGTLGANVNAITTTIPVCSTAPQPAFDSPSWSRRSG